MTTAHTKTLTAVRVLVHEAGAWLLPSQLLRAAFPSLPATTKFMEAPSNVVSEARRDIARELLIQICDSWLHRLERATCEGLIPTILCLVLLTRSSVSRTARLICKATSRKSEGKCTLFCVGEFAKKQGNPLRRVRTLENGPHRCTTKSALIRDASYPSDVTSRLQSYQQKFGAPRLWARSYSGSRHFTPLTI